MAGIQKLAFKVSNELSRQGVILVRVSASGAGSPGPFYTLGKQGDVEVNISPVEGDSDSGGRSKMLTLDVEITSTMHQTSDTELGAIPELTDQLTDVLVTPNRLLARQLSGKDPATEGYDADVASAAENGLLATDLLARVDAGINFVGESSSLSPTWGYRVPTDYFAPSEP